MKLTNSEKVLAELVSIPSITENTAANNDALDYVENHLRKHGMFVERLYYSEAIGERQPAEYGALVATTTPTRTPKVMLSAHIDVVPGPNELFALRHQGDKLLGRGVLDMKGIIAAFMATTAQRQGHLADYDYGITIVTNEEIGGKGTANVLKDGFTSKVAVLPDGGNDWQIEKLSKGAWTVTVDAPGVSAHGSRPWEGDSASFRLLDFLDDARKLFAGQGPDTDTLNISQLSGGQAQNQVPYTAGATLDIRVMGKRSLAEIQSQVAKLCSLHGVSWHQKALFPPLEHDMNNPYIKTYQECVKTIVGTECKEAISLGACDAVYYSEFGIPAIVTRPAGGDAHADSEWLSRRGFAQFIQVLGLFIDKTCMKP